MRRFAHPRLSMLVLLIAGICLSGCLATTAPGTRFYVLSAVDADENLPLPGGLNRPLSVQILSLRLPQYLERPQIVTRTGGHRLVLGEFDQWGGNLKKNMIRVMAENLSRLLATAHVAMPPFRPPAPADFRLAVEVIRFEKGADGRVRLSAQWHLLDSADPQSAITQITELVSDPVPAGQSYDDTVSAMSRVLGELSRVIGRQIIAQARPGPVS